MKENKVDIMIENIEKVIVGKREAIEFAVITLLSEGHLLLEDVPGVGKTVLAKAMAQTLGCRFARIQFTPDTLPGDVTGVSVYDMSQGTFRYVPGGIMNQIVLADEINRATPKTQASLLEAMAERQVTVDGKTYPLPAPFMVIATQNPIESLGTYHLPEAQLDRFFMKISMGYPKRQDEKNIIRKFLAGETDKSLESRVTETDILKMQEEVKKVWIHPRLADFVLELAEKTRNHEDLILGVSPRAVLAVIRGAQASAYLDKREYVIPDDIIKVIFPVWSHRLVLTTEAKMKQLTAEKIILDIRCKTALPVVLGDSGKDGDEAWL